VQRAGEEEVGAAQALGRDTAAGQRLERLVAHARAVVAAQQQTLAVVSDEKRLMAPGTLRPCGVGPDLDAAFEAHGPIFARDHRLSKVICTRLPFTA
jgi:hypothetical protein